MPLVVKYNMKPTAIKRTSVDDVPPRPSKPNWKSANLHNIASYNEYILQQMEPFCLASLVDLHSNCVVNCAQTHHTEHLGKVYSILVNSILHSGNICLVPTHAGQASHPKSIPGWDQSVRLKHDIARSAFLDWRACGSPKVGPAASQIRQTRLAFKYSLRKLKRSTNRDKANKLAASLLSQDPTHFWSLIKCELGRGTPYHRALVRHQGMPALLRCGRLILKQSSMTKAA